MASVFEPCVIGKIGMRNRLVRSATWEGLAGDDGTPGKELGDMLEELAAGGVGLIIMGYSFIEARGRGLVFQSGMHEDSLIPLYSEIVARVHAKGGKIMCQPVHSGGNTRRTGMELVAPSATVFPGTKEPARSLTQVEIEDMAAVFAAAALRAKKAGFDGIELHGAHGYLLNQFLSPAFNTRSDQYGGSIENRERFTMEVYRAVRAAVGMDYPIWIKLNCEDFIENGQTLEDAKYVAAHLASFGIDAIEVSGGGAGAGKLSTTRTEIDSPEKEAYFLDQAVQIKAAAAGIHTVLVGGIRSLGKIEEIFSQGEIDAFAMSRPFIREPDLIRKWENGSTLKAACVSCNKCFISGLKGMGISCACS